MQLARVPEQLAGSLSPAVAAVELLRVAAVELLRVAAVERSSPAGCPLAEVLRLQGAQAVALGPRPVGARRLAAPAGPGRVGAPPAAAVRAA